MLSQLEQSEHPLNRPGSLWTFGPLTALAAWCILVVMTDEPRDEEEYEPADIDPDNPIASAPDDGEPPVEANPADWADQHRVVPGESGDDERVLGDD